MTMNTELQKPNYLISLASSGMIVHVEVNVWSATKQDKDISEEVTALKRADKDAGRFVKHLLAGDPTHKELLNFRQTVYNWVKRKTYDWAGPSRYLPLASLQSFKSEFNQIEEQHKDLLDKFVQRYPDIIANMAFKQGDMFDANEYPSVDEMRNRFRINLYITDVPTGDFRNAIANDIAEDLKQHYQKETNDKIQEIMRDASVRLVDFIKRIANSCREVEPDANGKVRRPKVYETTLQQAKEHCNLLKDFNLTNDQRLEEMRVDLLNTIENITAEDIRDSDATRAHVKSEVDKIMSKFGI
jgi:hypothetical protein